MAGLWGIALSGGGAPGVAAHLGFLELLAEQGLLPPCMVGASAGGIAAATLAAGISPGHAITAWMQHGHGLIDIEGAMRAAFGLFHPSPNPGIIDLRSILTTLLPQMGTHETSMTKWRPGYGVVVSNMTTRQPQLLHANMGLFSRWTTVDAMTATAAAQGIFQGVRVHGVLYQDGGFLDDDPVDKCHALGAERVLLVRIASDLSVPGQMTLADLMWLSLSIGLHELSEARNPTQPAMAVDVATRGGIVSTGYFAEDVQIGRTAAMDALDKIKALAEG